MTAPMTRERLAELRGLATRSSSGDVILLASTLLELLSACETLLDERDAARNAALEEAARAITWPGYLGGYTGPEERKELEAFQQGLQTAEQCVRALKGMR